MNDKQLIVAGKSQQQALQAIQKMQVQGLAAHLQRLIIGGERYMPHEALALAQFAWFNRLNPTNGECWILVQQRQEERIVLGPMVGIKGLRRKANEALGEDNYWLEFFTPSLEQFEWAEGDIAYGCILRDSHSIRLWQAQMKEALEMFTAAGLRDPYDEAKKLIGPMPQYIGYGAVRAVELAAFKKRYPYTDPMGGGGHNRARKRAESAAIQQRFQLPYEYGEGPMENYEAEWVESPDIVNGEYSDPLSGEWEADQAEAEPQPKRSPEEILYDLGFDADDLELAITHDGSAEGLPGPQVSHGTPSPDAADSTEPSGPVKTPVGANTQPGPQPQKRQFATDVVKAVIQAELAKNAYQVNGRLTYACINERRCNIDEALYWHGIYYEAKAKGADAMEAARQANEQFMATYPDTVAEGWSVQNDDEPETSQPNG